MVPCFDRDNIWTPVSTGMTVLGPLRIYQKQKGFQTPLFGKGAGNMAF
jgi:hypothetical protein